MSSPEVPSAAAGGASKGPSAGVSKLPASGGRPAALSAADAAKLPPPLPFVPGSWTLVVVPDTQMYAEENPAGLEAQTRWIAAQRAARNVPLVVQVGDLTNRNWPEQWQRVRAAFRHLDGVVPYSLVTGNHDYGPGGDSQTRDSGLNEFFDAAEYAKQPTFGGFFEAALQNERGEPCATALEQCGVEGSSPANPRLENNYHLFTAGARDWLALSLEWSPRDAVVAWADAVLRQHARRRAIVVTHAYLYSDNTRYDHIRRPEHFWNPYDYATAKLPGGTNDGEDLWQKLIARHEHVDFVLSGHVLNEGHGRLSSTTPGGHVVHQLMADYQERPLGGEGYLRLMEFLPDGQTVQVKTYSPVLDRYLTEPGQQFVLKLDAPAAKSG